MAQGVYGLGAGKILTLFKVFLAENDKNSLTFHIDNSYKFNRK